MSKQISILTAILLPLAASAQLRFEPAIDQGINFPDTQVGAEVEVRITAIATPVNDVLQQVNVSIVQGEFFSAAPAQFNLEPEQREVIRITFRPQRAGNFEGALRVTAGSPMGRLFVYEARLTGRGVEAWRPRIIVDPEEFEVVNITADHRRETLELNIANTGDANLNWAIRVPEVQWLRVNPLIGRQIEPGGDASAVLTIDEPYPENGHFRADLVVVSNDPDNAEITVTVRIDVNLPEFAQHYILLRAGWNMISTNHDPGEEFFENGRPSMRLILGDAADNILIIKDGLGRFAIPRLNFWELRDWNTADGYQIKMSRSDTLVVIGRQIPFDRPMDLRAGWNLIAYYPDYRMRGQFAFDDLIRRDLLLIVKDANGRFALPRWWPEFFMCEPGQGYMVKVSENCPFRWAPRQ